MVEKVSHLGIQVDSASVLLAKDRLKAMGNAFGKVHEGQKRVRFGQKYTNITKKMDAITNSAILTGNSFKMLREDTLAVRFGPKYTNITEKLNKIARSANIASQAMRRLGASVKNSKLKIASPIVAPKITIFSSKQSVNGLKSISKQVKLVVRSFKKLTRSATSTGQKISVFVTKANRSLKRLVITAEKLAAAFGKIRLAQSQIRFGPKWDKINDTMRRLNVNSERIVVNINKINAVSARGAASMAAYGRASGAAGSQSATALRIARGQMSLTGVALRGLRSQVGQLAAAWLGFRAVVETFRLSGEYQGLHNLMKATGASTKTATESLEKVAAIAIRTRAPLGATARLYQRATLSAKELGASQKDILRFTENVGLALALQGGSVSETKGAILQLSQALGSVLVRGEEFNSIMTGALPIAQAAARGIERFGGSVSALRAEIVLGKVTSKEFYEAILSQTEILEQLFSRTTVTITQGFFVMQTGFTIFIGQMDKAAGVSKALGKSMQALGIAMFNSVGPAVDFITKHLNTMKGTVIALSGAITLKLTYSLYRASIAFWALNASAIATGFSTGILTGAVTLLSLAFKGLGRDIILTGIGGIIIVAGILIGKFLNLVNAAGGFGNALGLLNDVWNEVFDRWPLAVRIATASIKVAFLAIYIFLIDTANFILEKFNQLGNSIHKHFVGIYEGIKLVFQEISNKAAYVVGRIKVGWLLVKIKIIEVMNDIAESVFNGMITVVKHFNAAYESVKFIWSNLPEVLGTIVERTNDKILDGLKNLIRGSAEGINALISGANLLGANISTIDPYGDLAEVKTERLARQKRELEDIFSGRRTPTTLELTPLGIEYYALLSNEDEIISESNDIFGKIGNIWDNAMELEIPGHFVPAMQGVIDDALSAIKDEQVILGFLDSLDASKAGTTLGQRVMTAYDRAVSDFTAKPFEPQFNGAKAAARAELFMQKLTVTLNYIDISKPLESVKAIKDLIESYEKTIEETDLDQDDFSSGLGGIDKAAKALAETIRSKLISVVGDLISVVGDLANAFTDFVFRGLRDFKSFAKSIIGTFKNLLKEMVAMAIKRSILIKLGFTQDDKGRFTGTPKDNSIVAKLERHFSKLVSGGGVRSGGRREVGSEDGGGWSKRLFGGGDGKTYLQRYIGLEGKDESNAEILSRISSNNAQGGRSGGGAVGVISALSSAVSFITGGFATAAASIGATFITGATAIFGATGAVVSTAIVGALSAIALPLLAIAAVFSFFKKSRKITDTRIEVTFNKDSVDARTATDITTKRFWGLSKKRTTEYKNVDTEFGQILADFNRKSRASLNALGAAFGAENALDKFQFKIKFSTKGLSADQINKRIQQEFEAMTEAMARLIVGSQKFVREGETFEKAARRMAESISVVNSNFDRLGLRMFDISREGANAASSLTDILGGIQGFTSSINYYFKNFFDKSEQIEINTRTLTRALAALGVDAIPASKIAFRGLIQQMQEIGNTGAVGVLLKIAPLFIEIAGAANEAANANSRLFITLADEVFANSGPIRPFTRDGSGERIPSTSESIFSPVRPYTNTPSVENSSGVGGFSSIVNDSFSIRPLTRDSSGQSATSATSTSNVIDIDLLRQILDELRNGNITISKNTDKTSRILDRMERKDDALT